MNLFSLSLRLIHIVYSILLATSNIWKYFQHRVPKGLNARRSRLPAHLALALVRNTETSRAVAEKLFIESIERTVSWCRLSGIGRLTVYDREGLALKHSQTIQEKFAPPMSTCPDSTEPDIHYPITPPLSDYSQSRARSPVDYLAHSDLAVNTILLTAAEKALAKPNIRGCIDNDSANPQPFVLHFVSHESAKPAIASTARLFADLEKSRNSRAKSFQLSIDDVNDVLEGEHGLGSPDFLIIHPISWDTAPPELDGFPPWQIRLTEIYQTRKRWMPWLSSLPLQPGPIEEEMFRQGLDSFASAEMRLGK